MRIATERQDRRMLQQEQRVADMILLSRGDDLFLNGHGFRVWDATEMKKINVHGRLLRGLIPHLRVLLALTLRIGCLLRSTDRKIRADWPNREIPQCESCGIAMQ